MPFNCVGHSGTVSQTVDAPCNPSVTDTEDARARRHDSYSRNPPLALRRRGVCRAALPREIWCNQRCLTVDTPSFFQKVGGVRSARPREDGDAHVKGARVERRSREDDAGAAGGDAGIDRGEAARARSEQADLGRDVATGPGNMCEV